MKNLISHDIGTYIFNASAQTVTINGISPFALEQILTITNTTDGVMIYCFADPSLYGTLTGNVITLHYNTTSMANTDNLQIYMDLPSTQAIDNAIAFDSYTHVLLERICDLLEPMATQDTANRQRISLDAIPAGITLPTVTTVGTVNTLTTVTNAVPIGNVATLGGVDPRYVIIDTARNAYANGLRSKLTFS